MYDHIKDHLRPDTVIDLDNWDRPGPFYGCPNDRLPAHYRRELQKRKNFERLTRRQQAILIAQDGFCRMATDQRRGR